MLKQCPYCQQSIGIYATINRKPIDCPACGETIHFRSQDPGMLFAGILALLPAFGLAEFVGGQGPTWHMIFWPTAFLLLIASTALTTETSKGGNSSG